MHKKWPGKGWEGGGGTLVWPNAVFPPVLSLGKRGWGHPKRPQPVLGLVWSLHA